MEIVCRECGAKISSPTCDLVTCKAADCGAVNLAPKATLKLIRDGFERDQAHRAYPPVAVGRAIAYASGIYRLATHGENLDMLAVEGRLVSNNKSFKAGAKVGANAIEVKPAKGRGYRGMWDNSAGWMINVITGTSSASGQPWTYIYVVFRGSRGDKQGEANPKGAGWGKRGTGNVAEVGAGGKKTLDAGAQMQNLDWSVDLTGRYGKAHIAADPIKVRIGFGEMYDSCRQEIAAAVTQLMGEYPNSVVIVTGHSLGAGLAVVCAHHLDYAGVCKPFCFPFCTPRVGNFHFATDFQQRLANDYGMLWGELTGLNFPRCFNFVQTDDPVSWEGDKGYISSTSMGDMSEMDKSYKGPQTANKGLIKQAIWAKRHKKDPYVLFYQTPNVVKMGRTYDFWNIHAYTKMQSKLLGKSIFK